MRKSLALLTGAAAVASSFLLSTPASADHYCDLDLGEYNGIDVTIDNPLEGAPGVLYVCLGDLPTLGDCEFGGGVHVGNIAPPAIDPVVYRPCDGVPIL